MSQRARLLALILAVAVLVGLLAAARLAERRNHIDPPPATENTRPPETTAPQATIPDYTWAATPWG